MTNDDDETPVERPVPRIERYMDLLEKRRLAKEVVRGGLTPMEESYFAELLDECWQEMTEEERKVFE